MNIRPQSTQHRDGDPIEVPMPITVGVDGSTHNRPAITWAAEEARRSGRELSVLTASGGFTAPVPHFSQGFIESFDYDEHSTKVVDDAVESIKTSHPSISVRGQVRSGDAISVLVSASERSCLVVVGKRGLGAFKRVLLGSTSIAVVGRSTAPVVVVPDEWEEVSDRTGPILVGIDEEHDNDAVLDFAFDRASQLKTPLTAIHVWDIHPALVLGDEDRSRWGKEAQDMVERQLQPFRERYPDVEASSAQRNEIPALGLLDAAEHSQLLVLGRRSSSLRLSGLPFGSVTRAVLHYSERPVVVVPSRR